MSALPSHYKPLIGRNLFNGALEEIQALAKGDRLTVNVKLANYDNVDVEPDRLNVIHDGNGKIERFTIG